MNIFVLDTDPSICAQYHCDKHVIKMILETAQLLSTVIQQHQGYAATWLYRRTHEKHPCTKWAGESAQNFIWLQQLGFHLCEEYTYRYGKKHKSEWLIRDGLLNWMAQIEWPENEMTMRPQCMPQDCRDPFNVVSAYRDYYLTHKTHLLTYTRRQIPEWVACHQLGVQK